MLFLILTGGFQYLVAILFFYVLIKKIFQLCLTTDWDSLCVYSQLRYCKVKKPTKEMPLCTLSPWSIFSIIRWSGCLTAVVVVFLNDIDHSEQFQARRLLRAHIHPIPQPHIRNPLGHAVHMISVECLGDIQVGDHVSPLDKGFIPPLTSDFTDLCCRSCEGPWESIGWLGQILHNLTEVIPAGAYESNKWLILKQLP